MDLFRSVGFFVFGVFAVSLMTIPGVSAFDQNTHVPLHPWFRDIPAEMPVVVPADYPLVEWNEPVPDISAESVVILDVDSKVPIYQKNERHILYPASITKLVTALVALRHYSLSDVLTMPPVEVYPSVMGLQSGERVTVENALYGLLIASGNDAALALASNSAGGYEGFVAEMNQEVRNLGLQDTVFRNSSGLPEDGHVTSARDVAHFTAYTMQNVFIAKTVIQQRRVVYGLEGERHVLRTTNKLLGELSGLKGGKTGFTDEAGEVLTSYVDRNGRKIVVVVLKSKDRFGDSAALIEWAYRNATYVNAIPQSNQ